MHRNNQPSSPTKWPSTTQYSTYQPDRRLKHFWLLVLAIITLILSVTALIIVFAVEHSWFSDYYNKTTNHYGLWRLCFFTNQTCDSWFSSDGPFSSYIETRHNQDRVGINAWQALEIVFLFLTTSTLIIAVTSIVCYRLRRNIHYYLAILAGFAIWPAAMVGIAGLFVFGFSVYNASPAPHSLDWCFYVNLVAVILALISAIIITIYDILVKKPLKDDPDTAGINKFTEYDRYPPTVDSPPTYVVVRQNKKKKKNKEPYDYPQVLYPQQYFPPSTANTNPNTDYVTNPNHRMLTTPFASPMNNLPIAPPTVSHHQSLSPYRGANLFSSPSTISLPPPTQFYQPAMPTYPYQPAHWHRTGEQANDYIQRGIYRPTRLNPFENPFEQREEPRVLHYYTGYDHFSTVDPDDVTYARHHPSTIRSISPVRYPVNPPYYHQNNYIKSAL
ncbi:unnamed protein product [Adineta ricciae]|nr:unnamed protein product [Adineta ricciae]